MVDDNYYYFAKKTKNRFLTDDVSNSNGIFNWSTTSSNVCIIVMTFENTIMRKLSRSDSSNPEALINFICFKTVDLPDSPAPNDIYIYQGFLLTIFFLKKLQETKNNWFIERRKEWSRINVKSLPNNNNLTSVFIRFSSDLICLSIVRFCSLSLLSPLGDDPVLQQDPIFLVQIEPMVGMKSSNLENNGRKNNEWGKWIRNVEWTRTK